MNADRDRVHALANVRLADRDRFAAFIRQRWKIGGIGKLFGVAADFGELGLHERGNARVDNIVHLVDAEGFELFAHVVDKLGLAALAFYGEGLAV